MNKYYHRGNGEVVIPTEWEPDQYSGSRYEFEEHIASITIYGECAPSLPVGWLPECEERYEVVPPDRDGQWQPMMKELWDDFRPERRRIFLVPTTSKEEPLKHDFYVMQDYDGKFHVWSKKEYEVYIIGAVMVGGGSAFKMVSGFNGDENYLSPAPVETLPKGEPCTHEALNDTGTGYYHCPACNRAWSYDEWKSGQPKGEDEQDALWEEAGNLLTEINFYEQTKNYTLARTKEAELKSKYRIHKL